MVAGRLKDVATFTTRSEVGIVIRAAVLKRDNVIDLVVIGWVQLAFADVAVPVVRGEYPGDPLFRHGSALVVHEGVHLTSSRILCALRHAQRC